MPALSEIMPSIERTGLFVTDIEILRLHYAEALKAWHQRVQARRAEVEASRGKRFCCMWELSCRVRVRVPARGIRRFPDPAKKLETVPLKRDYIGRVEAYLRDRDAAAANLRLAGE